MAKKIDVASLQKQAERAQQGSERRALKNRAREKKELERKAKPMAREIIRSLPNLLRREARQGGNEVTVLNSSSVMDERLFKAIVGQVSSYCWKQENLTVYIKKHEPVGMDDYPYHETLVVGFKSK